MFNPAKASKNIKEEFIDYITTTHAFSDKSLQEQFVEELNGNISKGPILEIKDIFCSGKSINELIHDGVLCDLFRDLEKTKPQNKVRIPLDRSLYFHQEKAIRAITGGENVVVSTGTGSGKTNCFLIPVLNELLKEKKAGTLGPGIRALFIYPMNALANDQMKNIRQILIDYPEITFGAYNGGTENDEDKAIAVYEAMFATEKEEKLRHKLENEILSRDEMKKNPPNILFTNYAMLEHLLFRPKDDILFSKADFKYVVLDEAHIYNGATGIETALLLRRLKARITASRPTQFILTSATLGNDDSVDEDILTFAKNLCGVEFKRENIIRAKREKYTPLVDTINYSTALIQELADESNIVSDVLKRHGISVDDSKKESELLYDFLINSTLYNNLRKRIKDVCDIHELCSALAIDENTAIAFISLCTRAIKNGKLLVDARYHFFIRSLEGCYITLSNKQKLFLTRKKTYYEGDEQFCVFEAAICEDCGRFALVGKINNKKLEQVSKLEEKVDFFYLQQDDNTDVDDEDVVDDGKLKKETYYLCPHCGAIIPENEIHHLPCDCPKEDYVKIIRVNQTAKGAKCGNCHMGYYNRLYLGNDAATGVLATALYEELPELEYDEEIEQVKTGNIFLKTALLNRKKSKKTGRQFLVFSDSRQEAAKFACYLGKSYNEFLRRRGIWQVIDSSKDEIKSRDFTISEFVDLLTNYFTAKKSFAKSNSDESNLTVNSRRNAWVAVLNELARFNVPTSLTSLGKLQFEYLGNKDIISAVVDKYGVSENNAKNLLHLLSFEIIKMGAVSTDNESDINDDDREYIFYTSSQRFVKYLQKPGEEKVTISNWAPRNKSGKQDDFYKSNRLYYVANTLKIPLKDAAEFLHDYFEYLISPDNRYYMIDINKDGTYVMPAHNFVVKIKGSVGAKWYKCKKCGKITQFNLNGKCSSLRCEGELVEIDPDDIERHNHFAKLYSSERMSPLFVKEHTAQLSKKESAEYQEQFIKKDINALSCSTTFEMGVDVGDLETVFLRDVPPLPSNYAQRAGRAGRSVNAAAYALTFAKLSSHDLSFFKEPTQMIKGMILPPLFKIDNEKIVRRHIFAVALSMFFAKPGNEILYNYNNADKFINEKGYEKFIEWISSKPEELKEMLKKSIPDVYNLHGRIGINDFGWIEEFSGDDGVFTRLIREYENNIETFEKLIKKLKKEGDSKKVVSCEARLAYYKNNKLIDFLARGNVLPRYGFPVDTVELYQNTTSNVVSKLRLSRDLQVAIAEYAPSSEVVADGRLYTSRYIKKAAIGTNKQDWQIAYIGECPNCGTVNYSMVPVTKDGVKCFSCQSELKERDFHESIEPRSGFVAEREDKEVPLTRQEKNYRSEDYYIGDTSAKTIEKYKFKFNGIEIQVESTTNDSLMVKSTNNFYVCPKCGYSVASDESIGDKKLESQMHNGALSITMDKTHESLYGNYQCDCKELHRKSLHHVFKTDVAKITFECDTSDYNTMISTLYALLSAISKDLNIERRDIKAVLSQKMNNDIKQYSIVIYDAVPGGAGHSRRLVTKDGTMLHGIFMSALNNMKECDCEPSCYKCLRSYENQKIHDKLDRKLAENFLSQFVGDVEVLEEQNKE